MHHLPGSEALVLAGCFVHMCVRKEMAPYASGG